MNVWDQFKELRRYPSGVAGSLIIAALIIVSVVTVITIPYGEALSLWRGGEGVWTDTPRNAAPKWVNYFKRKQLPETIVLDTRIDGTLKELEYVADDFIQARMTLAFDYAYDEFPQELGLSFFSRYDSRSPYMTLTWVTPDGRQIELGDYTPRSTTDSYRLSQDERLRRRMGGQRPEVFLLADPGQPTQPLAGTHTLVVEAFLFEPEADLDAKFVAFGQVHGWAGTDHRRRDLAIALLWGTPIALAFGLLAAVGSTATTLVVAAAGVWYGRWIDGFIQRITEVNLILPLLPLLMMIGTFYSRSIWVMLAAIIAFNIFGPGIKTLRAVLLQIKEEPYIEAARAYGAGNFRIIFVYLIPRIIPMLLPQFVVIIPSFVFLEATLAVLGLGDPVLPTWGKLLDNARENGALYNGHYYWMLEPAGLLMITGLGFAMLGFALERVFNPKLREM